MINKNEVLDELQEIAYVIRVIAALIDHGYKVSIDEIDSWIGEGNVVQKINEYADNINIKTLSCNIKLVKVLRASTLSSDNPNVYYVSESGFCYLIAKLSECMLKELEYYKNGNNDY